MINSNLETLKSYALENPKKFAPYYMDNSESICKWIRDFDGVKTQMDLKNIENQMDLLSFSLVFSDLITLFAIGNGELELTVPKGKKLTSVVKEITFPKEIIDKYSIRVSSNDFVPAYVTSSNEQLKHFASELEFLLEKNKVVLRPDRAILAKRSIKDNDGNIVWDLIGVDPDSPGKQWLISEKTNQTNSLPIIDNLRNENYQRELQSITIPYLTGIKLTDLYKVIEDNNDCVSSFRSHIKELIQKHDSVKNLNEINQDLIRPDIDKLNGRFSKVAQMHKLRVYGTVVATAVVSLASLNALGINAAIFGLLGTGGLGILNSESKYNEEISLLKDNPMFLLWKIKQLRK
ncbi:MAG TPA: hypothetical protein VIH57_25735 [Bacteroidales bacterium]